MSEISFESIYKLNSSEIKEICNAMRSQQRALNSVNSMVTAQQNFTECSSAHAVQKRYEDPLFVSKGRKISLKAIPLTLLCHIILIFVLAFIHAPTVLISLAMVLWPFTALIVIVTNLLFSKNEYIKIYENRVEFRGYCAKELRQLELPIQTLDSVKSKSSYVLLSYRGFDYKIRVKNSESAHMIAKLIVYYKTHR